MTKSNADGPRIQPGPMTNVHANGTACRDIALLALDEGLSPGYPKHDGTKRPDGPWKKYQTTPASRVTVERWYENGATGVGLFTGYGNLELLEFDDRQTYERFKEAAVAFGLGDLVAQIEAGYLETTPGGGIHWLYRCDVVEGNTKLAERPKATCDDPRGREPLIETRGVGGWVVIAPSNGKVHPTGGRYQLVSGDLSLIITISPEERAALFALARTFDEIPVRPKDPPRPKGRPARGRRDGVTPLDDFNARAEADHRAILEGFGWTLVLKIGQVEYWRRPGKEEGWSATWGHTKGFRNFSSSTALAAESHTLANVYCVLKHRGDWTACVKDLVQQGYGTWIDDQGEEHQNPPPPGPKTDAPGPKPDGQDDRGRRTDSHADYILGKNELPVRCVSNTIAWLSQHKPGWARYDSFRRLTLLGGDPMTDHAVVNLVTEIEESLGMGWPRGHVEDALIAVAHKDEFSSLAQYLGSLEWDGINRLESFFPDHYEVEANSYHREAGRVLFLSAVARALDPGCKVDTVILLMGLQDLHKSLGMKMLCPRDEWFTDNIGDLSGGVETQKRLAGKWLVELSELEAMRKSEVQTVKSFISTTVDNYRPSYGRCNQDFPRTCIFVGTTNSDHPLQDSENRRFFPVRINVKGNLETIKATRDQLWAEAVRRYKAGEKWWTTSSDLVTEVRRQGLTARSADAYEEILPGYINLRERITVSEAAELLKIPVDRLDRSKQTQIGNALKNLGWKWRRESTPPRTTYYERPSSDLEV